MATGLEPPLQSAELLRVSIACNVHAWSLTYKSSSYRPWLPIHGFRCWYVCFFDIADTHIRRVQRQSPFEPRVFGDYALLDHALHVHRAYLCRSLRVQTYFLFNQAVSMSTFLTCITRLLRGDVQHGYSEPKAAHKAPSCNLRAKLRRFGCALSPCFMQDG